MFISKLLVAVVGVILALGECLVEREPAHDLRADELQRQGSALLDAGKLEDALGKLRPAFDLHRKVDDHASASSDALLIARTHKTKSAYREALIWNDRARAEAAMAGNESLEAAALVLMGNLLFQIGDLPRTEAAFAEAALHLPRGDNLQQAEMWIIRALALYSQGRYPQAEQLLVQAHDLARAAGDDRFIMSASINLAAIALDERRLDDAEFRLGEARAASHALGRTMSRSILTNEAELELLRGNPARAAAALDRAGPGADADPEWDWQIRVFRGRVAEAGGRLDEAENWYRSAMSVVERLLRTSAPLETKAPFLQERWNPFVALFTLQLARGDARGAFATLVQAQGRMFLDALALSLSETKGTSKSRVDAAIGRIDLLGQLVPALARSPLGEGLPSDAILAALRGKHVLAYFAGRERLGLVAVADGEPRITSVDVDLERLDRLIDDFRARPDDGRAAAALGAAILPRDALPATPGRVHVVPTGRLLRVPFAALPVAGGRFLDRYEIVYAPSVTGLAAIAAERGGEPGPAVVMADTRSDLKEARAELDAVVAATGAVPRFGPDATAAALRGAADARFLHLISHSGLNPEGGYLKLNDAQVTAAEILAWRVHPRLVVLPTCASAATVRVEMWDSLASAFLAAGSVHVVATLVSVEDGVAAEFTRLFYKRGGALDPVGATARAQREMARSRTVGEWSAFVVAGP